MNRLTAHVERPTNVPFDPGRDSAHNRLQLICFVQTSSYTLSRKLIDGRRGPECKIFAFKPYPAGETRQLIVIYCSVSVDVPVESQWT